MLKKGSLVVMKQKISALAVSTHEVGIVKKIVSSQVVIYFVGAKIQIDVDINQVREISSSDYGDDFPEKICNVCHMIYPTAEFDKNQNAKDNRTVRRPSCKNCRKFIDGLPIPGAEKRKWEKSKPNLTEFECPIFLHCGSKH